MWKRENEWKQDVEIGHLHEELQDVKARVVRLETTLARGLLLLLANLAGVIASLAGELFNRS